MNQEIKHAVSHVMVNSYQLVTFSPMKYPAHLFSGIREIKGFMLQISFNEENRDLSCIKSEEKCEE